jgi:nucleotide-binding universal stress UspA family protein
MATDARSIVVGVDGSPPSVRAALVAWRIAEREARPCHLVHAIPELPTTFLVPDLWRGARASGVRVADPHARGKVARALRTALPRAVADALESRPGRPPLVIADVARRRHATLVVLGASPESRGRTAQYLLRRGSWSLLIVRSAQPIRRILAAVDGSPASRAALRAGEELARIFDATLRAVHVLELSARRSPSGRLERSQEALSEFLSPHGSVDGSVREAATASAGIIRAATKWQAGLVIAATPRRGKVDRLLLGSTTERLLTDLPTSLLVVRASDR